MAFKSFIETQFPIAKLSAESYKERKANYSQTLTGLGKWWGRKPLVLVRASILGLLLPSTDDPKKDREIFLKIMTMDDEGLRRRRNKNFTGKEIFERATEAERLEWFTEDSSSPKLKRGLSAEQKELIQNTIFNRLPYSEKLEYCMRPEHLDGPSETAWVEINAHLGTTAQSIPELVKQLGEKQFGHTPKVGDAFCGGGSIPFEAARIGCEAYASDLNPVATLLTWASLNIVGGGDDVAKEVEKAQEEIYRLVDKQITDWGIEHNEQGHRADAYLYCCEVRCPESGWMVPLAPSWVIGEKTKCIAVLVPDEANKRYNIEIKSGVSDAEMRAAKASGTVKDSRLVHPKAEHGTPITAIRGDRRGADGTEYGLRLWENDDVVPRPEDVFQERLYCIRWVKPDGERYYAAPTVADIAREERVLTLLLERFQEWQQKGYIPSRRIEPGYNTDQPIRERGWTHWHHLFNPRQLLQAGLLLEKVATRSLKPNISACLVLGVGKLLDYNSRLSMWTSAPGSEKSDHVFMNQAFNTLSNYGSRALSAVEDNFKIKIKAQDCVGAKKVELKDVREISEGCDYWITDPPYADAVNYHELSEFFLAWFGSFIKTGFPDWYIDSKRALAIKGADQNFRKGMVQSYSNLLNRTLPGGSQIVMFTHQNAAIWADLTLILWASGLRVCNAWCVTTESDIAYKDGNFVQGTVVLILKKQTATETAFLDEVYPSIEIEVKKQLEDLIALDDESSPNFGDADYQLAAYSAALRVLTQFRSIEDINIAEELSRVRGRNDVSPLEQVIANAVRVACDFLIPNGFDPSTWRTIAPIERLYLKGLELESHKEFRSGVYQELARGFGVRDYQFMLSSERANQTRLKNATEFASRSLDDAGFGASPTRQVLFAIREIVRNEDDVQFGKNWLKNEVRDYWSLRKHLINISRYLAQVGQFLEGWEKDANAARLLAGALENDHA